GHVRERDDRRSQPEDGRATLGTRPRRRPEPSEEARGLHDGRRRGLAVGATETTGLVELSEEQQAVVQMVREFVDKEVIPVADELEHRDEFPEEIVEGMKKLGLFGLTVPEEYGGAGLDLMTYALAGVELSRG